MLNIGGWELLIILLVALLVLGPERLPEAARQIGKVTREVRKVTTGFQKELQDAMKDPVSTAAGTDVTVDASTPSDPFNKPTGTTTLAAASDDREPIEPVEAPDEATPGGEADTTEPPLADEADVSGEASDVTDEALDVTDEAPDGTAEAPDGTGESSDEPSFPSDR